jgi:glyoxylase-like metal-dependent hydrolase (beta-lactamase superfamily II)
MSGVFTLHALLAGIQKAPRWAILFGDPNPAVLQDLAFHVWVVTDGQTIGLVDTGLPLDATERHELSETARPSGDDAVFRGVRLLPDLLDDIGLSGSDVDFVAITQTVTYHTGGIDPDLLPRAHFYIPKAGLLEMLLGSPGHPQTQFYFSARGWIGIRQLAIEDRLRLVDDPTEIVPGVVFETTGGHHPGSAGLRIRTECGTTGLLETAFVQENLDTGTPVGISESIAESRSAIRRYLTDCDEVVAIHDAANVDRFPARGWRQGVADE